MLREQGDSQAIKPDTALGQALVDFFEVLEPIYAGGDHGVFRAIVFGGCAVHIHTKARGSADVDVEITSHGLADRSGNPVPVLGNLRNTIQDYHQGKES